MEPSIQTCPVCASDMLLKTARRGKNAGGQFWGCSNYPKCKGIVAFDSDDGKLNNDATQSTKKVQSDNNIMNQPIKMTDTEIAEIRMIQEKFQQKIFQLGQLALQKIQIEESTKNINQQESKLKDEWNALQKMEQELMDNFLKK